MWRQPVERRYPRQGPRSSRCRSRSRRSSVGRSYSRWSSVGRSQRSSTRPRSTRSSRSTRSTRSRCWCPRRRPNSGPGRARGAMGDVTWPSAEHTPVSSGRVRDAGLQVQSARVRRGPAHRADRRAGARVLALRRAQRIGEPADLCGLTRWRRVGRSWPRDAWRGRRGVVRTIASGRRSTPACGSGARGRRSGTCRVSGARSPSAPPRGRS